MNYSTIIFDFDGTLVDTLPFILKIGTEKSHKYTKEDLSKLDIESLQNLTIIELIKKLRIPVYKLPFIANEIRNSLSVYIDEMKLFPTLSKVLLDIRKKGLRLGIVSSNKEENIKNSEVLFQGI